MGRLRMVALVMTLGIVGACSRSSTPVEGTVSKSGEVRVVVTGLKSDDGTVRLGLYNSEEAYAQGIDSFRHRVLPIRQRSCEWIIPDVPYGEYAVSLYHDENSNEILDRNLAGIPVEPYGFSNNAKPALGMPRYDAVKFVLANDAIALEITVQEK